MMSAGTWIAGAVVSCTRTRNDACPVRPPESVAVQVTVVVPSGNLAPDAGEQLAAICPSTASVAVVAAYVTAAPVRDVASATMSAGTWTSGGNASGGPPKFHTLACELRTTNSAPRPPAGKAARETRHGSGSAAVGDVQTTSMGL